MRAPPTLFRWVWLGAIALVTASLQWLPSPPSFIQQIEHLIKDALRQSIASSEVDSRILIVDIDEASLAAHGAWPWPRARVADLVERLLGDNGARAVGLDIVFPAAADTRGDERLAAMGRFAPLVFAQAMDFVPRSPPLHAGTAVFNAPPFAPALVAQAASVQGHVGNHEGFSSALCVGNIGITPDADGRIRRVPLLARLGDAGTALLPLAMLSCPLGQPGPGAQALTSLQRAGASLSAWEVPYARQWAAYDVVSAGAVLDGSAPAGMVKGRWVLVGSSALGLNDRAATPLAAYSAGVMVHASAMTSLLDHAQGAVLPPPVDGRVMATAWIFALAALAAWALGRYRAWWLVPAAVLTGMAWLAVAAWLLRHEATVMVSGPLLTCVLVLGFVSLELWRVQREQSQLLRSFSAYVAQPVVDEMLRQGIANPMLPQHREITVISADMQNYSGLTNSAGLQDAAQLTREFLHCLTGPIFAHGGTLDKYTGDGLVAFWGAPLARADHTRQALEASREIVDSVRRWNETRVAQGKLPARVRIGIESGPVLVGDLGTSFRSTYTAVGDCINLAAKLQATAKTLQCDVVIGPQAAKAAGSFELVPVAQLQLPGFNNTSVLWSFSDMCSSLP